MSATEPLAPLESAPRGVPYVYVFTDPERELLYIGSTRDLRRRVREHARRSAWFAQVDRIVAFPYPTLDEALRDEAALIDLGAPRHNRQHVRAWSMVEAAMRGFFPDGEDRRLSGLLKAAAA